MPSVEPAKPHVAVSGASGLIGRALIASLLETGHRVTRLVRRPARAGEISWDPESGNLDPADLEGIDAVVHLAAENVGARWTARRKQRIRESRLRGTRLISEALGRRRGPATLVSASAIGVYGHRGDDVLTESSGPGDPGDFLVATALEWEASTEPARRAGVRVVLPRFGVVLSPEGGALARMLLPFRLGVGGRLGSGRQWMSWVSIHDVVGAIKHLLVDTSLNGPVNVTSPEPVTNRDFTRILGRVLKRPTVLVVPAFALRLAYGDMAQSTLLSSARVLPEKILRSGFRFRHPDLETALRHLLQRDQSGRIQT
jgi:uncharacterized protein (TIGR01777 family)